MNERFFEEVDRMLDGDPPDLSVLNKYRNSVRGISGDFMIMAQIALRAVDRKNGKKKAPPKEE